MPDPRCPLCKYPGDLLYEDQSGRRYDSCPHCGMVWMEAEGRLSREAEEAHYATHENSPDDPRYRSFLAQLWAPLKERLPVGARGLDYGSGPGSTLHLMAAGDGFPCTFFDPFFAPFPERLKCRYDFITCSETAEHFHHPNREFTRLHRILQPGGWLGFMTARVTSLEAFPDWYYRRDPTHVSFYQDETFRWIASEFGFLEPVFSSERVVLLQKSG